MGSTKLKEDLSNCLINFDRRVLITDLLDDYKLAYDEVNTLIKNYVEQQEKKDVLKFDKRYLVHGLEKGENKKEIYTIVKENKLKEWLKKLQNAESSLYSVEVAGGAKSAAPVFKPMREEEDAKIKIRKGTKTTLTNGKGEAATSKAAAAPQEKKEVKPDHKTVKVESPQKPLKKEESNKASPKAETSPSNKKPADKKSNNKKGGINNFFAPAAAGKKPEESKSTTGIIKPPTPKKMEDFFKKQTEKPKTPTETIKKTTTAANTSVQLFDDEEEEDPEVVESSDEEEKLEALKRDIISSDVEMEPDAEEETDSKPSTAAKRRRILDSDDEEEDPPVKHEKLDIKEETKAEEEETESPLQDETFLDEDGFVITKKPKQKASASSSKSPAAAKKTPAVTLKTSPKETKKSTSTTKTGSNPAAKTKQAGIMNFFSKK